MSWANKKVLVLGMGISGLSTAKYLLKRGASVLVSDSKVENEKLKAEKEELLRLGARVELGGHSQETFKFPDLVVVSPGIPPSSPVIKELSKAGIEIICDVELAGRECTAPMVVITGTNGKSTTCALISHILTSNKYKAPACGNIGLPVLSVVEDKPDYLVVEASSYQLYYSSTLSPQIALWLNLTPDHIEWHGSLEHYIDCKKKVFANQTKDQYAVLNIDDEIVAKFSPQSRKFSFSTQKSLKNEQLSAYIENGYLTYNFAGKSHVVCHENELQIIGSHNLENALAAISATTALGLTAEDIAKGLKSFTSLEHRLEYIDTIDGIKFYNDSKATNPESTIKALEAFKDEKIVLIAGGRDKGTTLNNLSLSIKKHASSVILLGEAKERFASAFKEAGFENLHMVESLDSAIELGLELKEGPVVLSPACASFDMFANFEERGRVFKNLVRRKLKKVATSR